MNKKINSRTIVFKAETVSPVHIGSGETLQEGVDFFTGDNKIGKVDPKKILNVIGEDKIQWWTGKIENGESIWNDLKNNYRVALEGVCKEILPNKTGTVKKQLKEQFRNQYTKNPVLPGSSIKGALRTAIVSPEIIKKYKNKQENFRAVTFKDRQEKIKFQKEDKLFGDLLKINTKQNFNPQNDIFKFIKIADAEIPKENLSVSMFQTLNMNRNDEWQIKNQLSTLVEVVDAAFEIKMVIDERFFEYNRLGIKNKEDIIKRINEHTLCIAKQEFKAFKGDLDDGYIDENIGETIIKQYKKIVDICQSENVAVFRMSSGSGWDYMTGGWLKEITSDNEWNKIKKLLARRGYEDFSYPKTRRLLHDYRLPGFVKIEF